MEYKKAYEEAIERAKAGKPLDEVFPELKLKESEDERIRKELLEVIRHCYEDGGYALCTDDYKKYSAYLEKHKEPFIIHDTGCSKMGTKMPEYCLDVKPAEWSEEDEEMLDAMIDMVSNSLYEPLCPREGMLAWLKSLRPQPHWKPSKEQMRCLKYAIDSYESYEAKHHELQKLYNDLEKL